MYEESLKLKEHEYKVYAALHGIDLFDKEKNEGEVKDNGSVNSKQSKNKLRQPANQTLPLFRDPSEYAHMSQEERQSLTDKMKSQHKSWVKKGKLPKG